MAIRIKDKKRFTVRIAAVVFILIVSFLAIGQFIAGGLNKVALKSWSSSHDKEERVVLASSSDGNIFIDENNFFKRIVIVLPEEQKEVSYIDEDKMLRVRIEKTFPLEVNSGAQMTKSQKESITGDMYISSGREKNTLNISKLYKDNNYVYVDDKDKRKITVLISKSENPFQYKAVIDPGHGGIDKGVNIGNVYEKDIVLKIAKYMVNDLRYNGVEVRLSREEDKLLALSEVAEFVNKINPDVFLSIHVNSFKDSRYQGIGTYYYDDGGFQKEERISLANTIQKHVVKDDAWEDRGLFRDKLKVLRLSKVPCVLVECGFLTNAEDKKRLLDEKVLANLASNLNNALMEYLKAKPNQ